MAVSRALMEIHLEKEQAIFNSLQIGDLVLDSDNEVCLIVEKFKNNWNIKMVRLLRIHKDSYMMEYTIEILSLILVPPKFHTLTSALLDTFKQRLEWASKYYNNTIDNLTYVEILVRLKEYERTQPQ